MSKVKERGYWWECSKCDHKNGDLEILKLLIKLSVENWDQELLRRKCPDNNCNGKMYIAFYYNKKKKEVVLLKHVVGISYDDKIRKPKPTPMGLVYTVIAFLPMMWEWHYKFLDNDKEQTEPHFDFKYIDTSSPNPKTLTSIVSLTQTELKRLIELYREKTNNDQFLI